MNTTYATALGLLLAVPCALRSQEPQLIPGSRVRLSAPDLGGRRLTGVLRDTTRDTLRVAFTHRGPPVAIPMSRLSGLEVSRGRRTGAGAVRGALIGFATGVLLTTATVALATGGECLNVGCVSIGTAYVAGAGLLVGAVVGATAPPERWTRVSLPGERARDP